MRLAFFLLVLANLAFFVWAQGYLGGQKEGREPQRLKEQLQPEKIDVMVQAPPPPPVCRRVAGLAAADAEKLRLALEADGSGLRASVQASEETPGFWANIPALPNQAAADKKAAELRQFGITDFHVVQQNGGFAISLGIFRDENAAKDFLQQLKKKGVNSARVDARTSPAPATVEVRGSADVIARRLPPLLADIAGAAAADCP